jgi:hypothetical protein
LRVDRCLEGAEDDARAAPWTIAAASGRLRARAWATTFRVVYSQAG